MMILGVARNLAVIVTLALVYLFLRYPLSHIELPFYDDGETLYHVLSVLKGRIPYHDDFSHHFLGYLIPYLLLSGLVGFSISLVPLLAVVTQSLMGWGVFLILKRFVSGYMALLGALLAVTAREPWVLGFFVQYQFNLLLVFIWYFLIRYLNEGQKLFLTIGSLLIGMLLISDQRVVFIPLLSYFAIWLRGERRAMRMLCSSLVMSAPMIVSLVYLFKNGALRLFIEQTIIFPILYRSGSSMHSSLLSNLYNIHRYLWGDTLVIFVLGVLGAAILMVKVIRFGARGASSFLLFAGLIQATIPLLGGRDYDYYTIPWIPWLAIMSVIGGDYLMRNHHRLRRPILVVMFLPIIISLIGWKALRDDSMISSYRGDGVQAVAEKLKSEIASGHSVYLWGYRLELYVRLNTRSAYPFANNLSIHPDPQIEDPAQRQKYISPSYEAYFLHLLSNSPPDILVFFTLNGHTFPSPADTAIRKLRDREYDLMFETTHPNFKGDLVKFEVYKHAKN